MENALFLLRDRIRMFEQYAPVMPQPHEDGSFSASMSSGPATHGATMATIPAAPPTGRYNEHTAGRTIGHRPAPPRGGGRGPGASPPLVGQITVPPSQGIPQQAVLDDRIVSQEEHIAVLNERTRALTEIFQTKLRDQAQAMARQVQRASSSRIGTHLEDSPMTILHTQRQKMNTAPTIDANVEKERKIIRVRPTQGGNSLPEYLRQAQLRNRGILESYRGRIQARKDIIERIETELSTLPTEQYRAALESDLKQQQSTQDALRVESQNISSIIDFLTEKISILTEEQSVELPPHIIRMMQIRKTGKAEKTQGKKALETSQEGAVMRASPTPRASAVMKNKEEKRKSHLSVVPLDHGKSNTSRKSSLEDDDDSVSKSEDNEDSDESNEDSDDSDTAGTETTEQSEPSERSSSNDDLEGTTRSVPNEEKRPFKQKPSNHSHQGYGENRQEPSLPLLRRGRDIRDDSESPSATNAFSMDGAIEKTSISKRKDATTRRTQRTGHEDFSKFGESNGSSRQEQKQTLDIVAHASHITSSVKRAAKKMEKIREQSDTSPRLTLEQIQSLQSAEAKAIDLQSEISELLAKREAINEELRQRGRLAHEKATVTRGPNDRGVIVIDAEMALKLGATEEVKMDLAEKYRALEELRENLKAETLRLEEYRAGLETLKSGSNDEKIALLLKYNITVDTFVPMVANRDPEHHWVTYKGLDGVCEVRHVPRKKKENPSKRPFSPGPKKAVINVGVQNTLEEERAELQKCRLSALRQREVLIRRAVQNLRVATANIIAFNKNMEVDLTCKHCFNIYSHAHILNPCGHSFCQKCLEQMCTDVDSYVCSECGNVSTDGGLSNCILNHIISRWNFTASGHSLLESLAQLHIEMEKIEKEINDDDEFRTVFDWRRISVSEGGTDVPRE